MSFYGYYYKVTCESAFADFRNFQCPTENGSIKSIDECLGVRNAFPCAGLVKFRLHYLEILTVGVVTTEAARLFQNSTFLNKKADHLFWWWLLPRFTLLCRSEWEEGKIKIDPRGIDCQKFYMPDLYCMWPCCSSPLAAVSG